MLLEKIFDGLNTIDNPTLAASRAFLEKWRECIPEGAKLPSHSDFKFLSLGHYLSSAYMLRVVDDGRSFELVAMGDNLSNQSRAHRAVMDQRGLDGNNPLVRRWVPILKWFVATNHFSPMSFTGRVVNDIGLDGKLETTVLPIGQNGKITHLVACAGLLSSIAA